MTGPASCGAFSFCVRRSLDAGPDAAGFAVRNRGISQISACLVGLQPQNYRGQTIMEFCSMHQGAERRVNPRDRIATEGMIWRGRFSIVPCVVRDLSPAGVGLVLSDSVRPLPPEFDLTVDRVTHRCIAVWRQRNRMGLKFKSVFDSRRDRALWIALALCGGQ
jgi:hypothetical protein